MPHLVTLVLLETHRVNQVVPVIVYVTSKELVLVSHLPQAQRAIRVALLVAGRVRLHQ